MTADGGRLRRDLVLLGGGEHARVVLDAARCSEAWNVVGFVDPASAPALASDGVAHLGDDALEDATTAGIIAVGGTSDAGARARIAGSVVPGGGWATIVHPTAIVAKSAVLEEGVVVLAGAIVNPGCRIGAHAIINSGAVVEHDVEVGTLAHIGPAAAIGGGTTVGDRVVIGLGARIRDHVTIGADALVGMGAVVVGDVDAATRVVGVPARVVATVR